MDEQYILPRMGSNQHGQYVAMDVKARGGGPGDYLDYEVGDSELTVAERLPARHPDGILYTVRVGYPAVVTMRRHGSGTAL